MPQEIVCSRCGYVLYKGDVLKPPQDIIRKYNGRCPKCGRELSFSPDRVKITPYRG